MDIQTDKLKDLLDRVLNQHGKTRRGNTQICYFCPWCHHVKRKLEIAIGDIDFGCYHCWVCNQSGKSLKSLFFKLHTSKQQLEELFFIIGYSYKERKENVLEEIHYLPSEFKPLNKDSDSFSFGHAWYYLSQRGITRNDVLRYNIGYCDKGEYANRIVIPSYDKDGNLNFFSARDYSGKSLLKYMLSPWSKNIIGFEVFINWSEPTGITLVEGAFDAISIRKNAIPLFGKSMPFSLKLAMITNGIKRVNRNTKISVST